MAKKVHVVVGYVLATGGVSETHPLIAYIADAETGIQLSQAVNHRDMRQVRCYYNGWSSALHTVGVREIQMDHVGIWPYARDTYEVPVNFPYIIADSVPEELRFSNDT